MEGQITSKDVVEWERRKRDHLPSIYCVRSERKVEEDKASEMLIVPFFLVMSCACEYDVVVKCMLR